MIEYFGSIGGEYKL